MYRFTIAVAALTIATSGCGKKDPNKSKTTKQAEKSEPAKQPDEKPTPVTKPKPVSDKPAMPTPKGTIVGEEVAYEGGGAKMKGYVAYDKARTDKRPGVLVVHEWWGHNAYARERAHMLAELGYTALAVDMFGDGRLAAHPDDAKKFSSEVSNNLDAAELRFMAALELLKRHETTDPEKTAAIGYCFGGGVVLHAARTGIDLDGVVSFHGSLVPKTPAKAGGVKAAVLVCNGADDPFVTPEEIEAFKKEMADAKVDMRFESYAGATHSFTSKHADVMGKKFDMPLAYNADADAKSWAHMQEFFAKIFK